MAAVLVVGDIADPVQLVLDAPVARARQAMRAGSARCAVRLVMP